MAYNNFVILVPTLLVAAQLTLGFANPLFSHSPQYYSDTYNMRTMQKSAEAYDFNSDTKFEDLHSVQTATNTVTNLWPHNYQSAPSQKHQALQTPKKTKCHTWTSPEGIQFKLNPISRSGAFGFNLIMCDDDSEAGKFSQPYYSPGSVSEYVFLS